jgi:GT2 family glycosyltransferase
MKKISYSILIPSYNGLALLKKHLPTVIKFSSKANSILVVDDGSTDSTAEFLKNEYPNVKIIHHHQNLGFTKSVNFGVESLESDYVVLLNNDVEPVAGYLDKIFNLFTDKVFAVNFNESGSSWPLVSWRGKLQYQRAEDKSRPYYTAWASGGSAVFCRDLWENLGGFDPVFSPGYWEDIDLGWRAWKAGYKIIFDPDSKIVHKHESSFSLINRGYMDFIKQRNELIFNWKNITNPVMRREHFVYLFRRALFHPGYLKVILSALKVIKNARPLTKAIHTDREVLSLINQPV